MKRVYACLFFAMALFLVAATSHATMTYLKVQNMDSNFTMVQGDVMTWEADCAPGATVMCEIWLDINENDTIEPGTDYQWMDRTIPWQDGGEAGGPPDMDTTVNGHLYFAMVLGFPPGKWILRFTDPTDMSTQVNAGTVSAIAAPFRRITGTVSGPGGFDPSFIIVSTENMWMALTDSLGNYVMDFDSSFSEGNLIKLGVDDISGYTRPEGQEVLLDTQYTISGIDFQYEAPAAYVYGRILDNLGQPVTGNVYGYARLPMGGGNDNDSQADGTGFYQLGFSPSQTGEWRIGAYRENDWSPDYMQPRETTIMVNDNDSIQMNFTVLRADTTITGRITENGGAPTQAYRIGSWGNNNVETYSDSLTGNYTLHVSSTLGQMWVQINTDSQYGTPLPPGYTIEGDWQKEAYPGDTDIDFNLVRGGSISGRVRAKSAGTSISGIKIELRGGDGHNYGSATTDVDGKYTISGLMAGHYRLQAQGGSGFVGEWYNGQQSESKADLIVLRAGVDTMNFDFSLSAGAIITGRVTDQGMNPLSNMWVDVRDWQWSANYGGNTDDSGYYSITVPAGTYRAQVNSQNGYLGEWHDNTQDNNQAETLRVSTGETADSVDFKLAQAAYITGTVRDKNGNRLKNVNVMCQNVVSRNWFGSNTDDNGEYTIATEPGRQIVVISNPPVGYARLAYNQKPYSGQYDTLEVLVGNTATNVDFALAAGSTISGHIYDDKSQPLKNYFIEVRDTNNNGVAQTNTDNDGAFTLTVEPGTYCLQASSNNGYIGEYYNNVAQLDSAARIVISDGQNLTGYNFYLDRSAQINGYVKAQSDGKVLSGAEVQLERGSGGGAGSHVTDATGYYSFQVEPGKYFIRVQNAPPGYFAEEYDNQPPGTRRDTITLASGENRYLEFSLSSGFRLSGRVRKDADSSAAVNVDVRIEQWTGMWWNQAASTNTNDSGEYTLTGLTSGTYRLYFSGAGFITEYYNNKQDQSQAVQLNLNNDTTGFNAYLAQGASLSGTVLRSSDSAPISNVNIQINRQNGMMWNQVNSTNTSPTGTYTLSGLTTGLYRLFFNGQMQGYLNEYYNDKQMDWEADTIRITAGHDTSGFNASLAQGASLSGTVLRSSDSAPISNVNVRISQWTGMWWNQVASTNTSPTGTYTLSNLATGLYRLYFEGQSQGYVNEYYNDKQMDWQSDTIRITAGHDTTGFNATLERGASLSGTVIRSSDSAPISNVNVQIYQQNGMMWNQVNSTSTSPTGSYTLSGLTTGLYRLFFNGQMQGYVNEYYNDKQMDWQADTIRITAGHDTSNFNASLAVPGTLAGRVVRTTGGTPVQWQTMYLYNASFVQQASTMTNSNGDYSFGNLPPGTYYVQVVGNGDLMGEYYNNAYDSTNADTVIVTSGATRTGVDFSLENLGAVAGYVTSDSSGNTEGLDNVTVYLYAADDSINTVQTAITDANGYYRFAGLNNGQYRIYVSDHWSAYWSKYTPEYYNDATSFSDAAYIAVTANTTTQADVGLDVARGSISGTVTLQSTGTPLENMEIWAYNDQLGLWSDNAVYTDANGFYQIDGLSRGNWRVQVWPNGDTYAGQWYFNTTYYAAAQDLFVNRSSTVTNINFQMTYLSSISGTVTAEGTGNPVPGAVIWLWDQNNATWFNSDTTDGNGDYSFSVGGDFGPDLLPGNYKVMAEVGALGYADEWWDNQTSSNQASVFYVAEGVDSSNINFVLAPGSSLSGTIRRQSDNALLAGMVVTMLDDNMNLIDSCTTDANGLYTFVGIGLDTYVLRVNTQAGYFGQNWNNNAPVVIDHRVDTTMFDFTLEGAAYITGTLNRAADNQPQMGWVTIQYTNIDSGTVSTFNNYASGYQLELHAGTYEVVYYSSVYRNSLPKTITVGAGETAHHDFTLAPRLVINEIYANGGVLQGDQSTNPEFVELYAVDSANISNFGLRNDWRSWWLPGSCPTLPAGSYAVVHMGDGSDYTAGNVHHIYLGAANAMSDNQGYVGLTDNSNQVLDVVAYGGYTGWNGDWCGWPTSGGACADGGASSVNERYSVSLLPDGDDQNNGSNWSISERTPGAANAAATSVVDDVADTGTYTFGNVGAQLNITSLTGFDVITVTVNGDSFPAHLGTGNPIKRWFTIHTGTGITGIRAVVTFSYTQAEFDSSDIANEATLYAARWNTTTLTWEIYPSVVDTINNTITCTTTVFSDWALGGEGSSVPVELTALTAQVNAGAVQIDWATASEQGNLGWNIYRRIGASAFTRINTQLIPGGLTTTRPGSYQYLDPVTAGMSGMMAYYLEQVDLNGATHQSPVISVNIAQPTSIAALPYDGITAGGLTVTPNPFTAAAAIKFTLPQPARVELAVYNMRGSLVRPLAQGTLATGSHQFVWDGSGLTQQRLDNGVYTIRLTVNGLTTTYGVLLAR